MLASQSAPSVTTKVCIVGAGVSGLRAADVLLNTPDSPFSASDVVIVEAQPRIGGRILTDKTLSKLGLSYDLGAAWFHDALTNPVLHESLADGSFAVEDGYFDDKDLALYTEDGRLAVNELKLHRVLEEMHKFIELHYAASLDVKDVSLDDISKLYFDTHGRFLTPEQKRYCGRMLRYLELWYGTPSDKISAKYSLMDHQGRNFYCKKGYSFLIDKLHGRIKCPVLLSQQVEEIQRGRKSGPANLLTLALGKQIAADYVVVTVPHSVLALPASDKYGITWTPPLPKHMTDAIAGIHFGALGKVVLEFDDVWWDPKEDLLEVLPHDVSPRSGDPQPFQYPIFMVNYARLHKGAASLVVFTQLPVTQYLEANPDKAWAYLKPMLATVQVKPMSDPINVIVTDWTTNPYARGSYSAMYVGDDAESEIIHLSGEYDQCGLGPDSSIRFAGEHTIAEATGCVHGAYNSGLRAAEWILQHK